jgi:hypothetical protein
MNQPRILLEISTAGITETGIIANTAEESIFAHKLLATVAFELRQLNQGLKEAADKIK